MKKALNPIVISLVAAGLSACGGGGDDSGAGANSGTEGIFSITVIDGYLNKASITAIESGRCDTQLGDQAVIANTTEHGKAEIANKYLNHTLCAYAVKGVTIDEDNLDGSPVAESFVLTVPRASQFNVITPYTSMVNEALMKQLDTPDAEVTNDLVAQAKQTVIDSLTNVTNNSSLVFGDYVSQGFADENGDMALAQWQAKTLHNVARSYVIQKAKLLKQLNEQVNKLKESEGNEESVLAYKDTYHYLLVDLISKVQRHANDNAEKYRDHFVDKDLVGNIDFGKGIVSLPEWNPGDVVWTIPEVEVVSSISFELASNSLAKGKAQSLGRAKAKFPNGNSRNLYSGVTWESSNQAVAKIENGKLHALGLGTTQIIANYGELSHSVAFEVTAAILDGISIEMASQELRKGDQGDLPVVTSLLSDGSQSPLTAGVTWTTSDSSKLVVEDGKLVAKQEGTVMLTASYEGFSESLSLKILPPVATAMSFSVDTSKLHAGTSMQLGAIEVTFSDGTTETVSSGIEWSSDTAGLVSGNTLNGIAQGSYSLTATYQGVSKTITIEVLEPTLTGITITIGLKELRVGDSLELGGVSGIYSDGSGGVIEGAVWRSLSPSVAVIEGGNVKALAVGSATVEASFGGFTESKSYTVVKADLEDIRFTGLPESLATGLILNLPTVFGRYSDGSEKPITDQVTWKSSDTLVAAIASNQIKALKPGSTTITASYQGKEHTYNLAIGEAEITDIALNIDASDFNKGEQLPLEVVATLTDDTTKVITEGVIWTVSDETVLGVSDMTLVAKAEGSATLTAKLKDAVAPTVEITVLPPTVASMSPDWLTGTLTLTEGDKVPMDITFTFTDGTTESFNQVTYFHSGSRSDYVDESGLNVVKLNKTERYIRAVRKGTHNSLQLSSMPARLNELLRLYVDGQQDLSPNRSYTNLKVSISNNPDVYQWHRIIDTVVGEDAFEAQTIVSNDTIYRFWNVDNGPYYDVYVGKVDKNGVSEYRKLLDNRVVINNELIDGGGHGYYAMVTQNSTEVQFLQLLDLKTGELGEPVVISKEQFSPTNRYLSISDSEQVVFVDKDGTPIIADHDSSHVFVYRYNKANQSWSLGSSVKGEVIQLKSYPDHIVVADTTYFNSTEQVLPTYHFISRSTGLLERSISMTERAVGDGTCKGTPQLIPQASPFVFAGYCVETDGYHLWSDITQLPYGIYPDPMKGEEVVIGGSYGSVANQLPNGNIIGQSYLTRINDEEFIQVNELNPSMATTKTYLLDWRDSHGIAQPTKYEFIAHDSTDLGQNNPHVDNEWVQIFSMNMGIRNAEGWSIDSEMYALPKNVTINYSLLQSQNTWFLLNDTGRGQEIWYLQHRNPSL